jgi:hypothetical protein
MAKSMKLGGGGRFAKMEKAVEKEGYSKESAGAITAAAGRKKLGNEKMNKLAKAGKTRTEKHHEKDGRG